MAQDEKVQPTQREAFFFLEILAHQSGNPQVDWAGVAAKCGYSNAACAQTRFRQIKKRLGWEDTNSADARAAIKSRPTPTKKAGSSFMDDSPSKVVKKGRSRPKKEAGKIEKGLEDEDSYEVKKQDHPMKYVDDEDVEDETDESDVKAAQGFVTPNAYFDAMDEEDEDAVA